MFATATKLIPGTLIAAGLIVSPPQPDVAPKRFGQTSIDSTCNVLCEMTKRALAYVPAHLRTAQYHYELFLDIDASFNVPPRCKAYFDEYADKNRAQIEAMLLREAEEKVGGTITHKEVEWLNAFRAMDALQQEQQLLLVKVQKGQLRVNELKPSERIQIDRINEQLRNFKQVR